MFAQHDEWSTSEPGLLRKHTGRYSFQPPFLYLYLSFFLPCTFLSTFLLIARSSVTLRSWLVYFLKKKERRDEWEKRKRRKIVTSTIFKLDILALSFYIYNYYQIRSVIQKFLLHRVARGGNNCLLFQKEKNRDNYLIRSVINKFLLYWITRIDELSTFLKRKDKELLSNSFAHLQISVTLSYTGSWLVYFLGKKRI